MAARLKRTQKYSGYKGDYVIFAEKKALRKRWPWLTYKNLKTISDLYQRVVNHEGTIEQVADYVRSVEPLSEVQDTSLSEAPTTLDTSPISRADEQLTQRV